MVRPFVQRLSPTIVKKGAQTHRLVFDMMSTRAAYSLQMVRIWRLKSLTKAENVSFYHVTNFSLSSSVDYIYRKISRLLSFQVHMRVILQRLFLSAHILI